MKGVLMVKTKEEEVWRFWNYVEVVIKTPLEVHSFSDLNVTMVNWENSSPY